MFNYQSTAHGYIKSWIYFKSNSVMKFDISIIIYCRTYFYGV